jgi:hypothetical protein
MQMMMAAIVVALFCTATAADAGSPSDCSDRNALNDISVDARLAAIKFYYAGLVQGLPDRERRACYEAQILEDSKLAIVNKTLELIEGDCLPIGSAAGIAAKSACP